MRSLSCIEWVVLLVREAGVSFPGMSRDVEVNATVCRLTQRLMLAVEGAGIWLQQALSSEQYPRGVFRGVGCEVLAGFGRLVRVV